MAEIIPIQIDHFSDVLCIWAYVAQVRLDHLLDTFPTEVTIDYQFVEVFGYGAEKLSQRWQDRGGLAAYGQHVLSVAATFDHVAVHPEIWTKNVPQSSTACHLFLHAVKLLELKGVIDPAAQLFQGLAWAIRQAFFQDLEDVSQYSVLSDIAAGLGLPLGAIEAEIHSGAAYAQLAKNWDRVKEYGVTVSPTLIFNQGRQQLSGNVGYRVIQANIQELIHQPADQQSWC